MPSWAATRRRHQVGWQATAWNCIPPQLAGCLLRMQLLHVFANYCVASIHPFSTLPLHLSISSGGPDCRQRAGPHPVPEPARPCSRDAGERVSAGWRTHAGPACVGCMQAVASQAACARAQPTLPLPCRPPPAPCPAGSDGVAAGLQARRGAGWPEDQRGRGERAG